MLPANCGLRSSCRLCPLHLVRVLHDTRCDGLGRFVAMGVVTAPVEVVVDETDFDEDGRHDGIAQDEESGRSLSPRLGRFRTAFKLVWMQCPSMRLPVDPEMSVSVPLALPL